MNPKLEIPIRSEISHCLLMTEVKEKASSLKIPYQVIVVKTNELMKPRKTCGEFFL